MDLLFQTFLKLKYTKCKRHQMIKYFWFENGKELNVSENYFSDKNTCEVFRPYDVQMM